MKQTNSTVFLWALVLAIFVFPVLPITTIAQNAPLSESLTLSESIQIAAKENPKIKAASFQEETLGSQVLQARSGFFPVVDFTETYNRTNNPMWAFGTKLNQGVITQADFDPETLNDPDDISNFASAVSMAWTVYDGGRTKTNWKQAHHNHTIASSMLKQTRQDVIAQTAKAYIGMLLAQKSLMVIEQSLDIAKTNLKMVNSRFKSGFVVKSDFLRAKVRVAELEQQRLQSESQLKIAEAVLNANMGYTDDRPLRLVSPLSQHTETTGSIDEWIEIALSRRPDLEKLGYQEDIAKEEINKAYSEHFPDVKLIGNYEINSEDFSDTGDNYTVGAVMRVNLFSGNRISSKTKSAKSTLRSAKALRKNLELVIRVQVRESFLATQSAWQRIQVAQRAVEQAKESLRIVKNRYNNGLLTIVDLLDAELTQQQSQTNHFKALHDYKVARINLAQAVGTIDTDFK